jgi:hypothetical protein
MSPHPDDRDHLSPEDEAFVRRIAESYAPAPLTPNRRAAFDAELELRLARDRWRLAPWAAAVLVAGTAALLVITRLPATPQPSTIAADAADTEADEEFVLALAGGSSDDFDRSLPTDYQAIASLLEPQ